MPHSTQSLREMRPVATDGVAWSVSLCVYLSVGHVREPCKNGWTDQDEDWRVNSGGSKEPYIRLVRDPTGRDNVGNCPAIKKHWESVLSRITQQKKSITAATAGLRLAGCNAPDCRLGDVTFKIFKTAFPEIISDCQQIFNFMMSLN